MKFRNLFVIAALFVYCAQISAQESDPSKLSLQRLFGNYEFFGDRFGPAVWFDDGLGYITLERSAETTGGQDMVYYDAETGDSEIMVPASRMIPEGESAPLRIASYKWSPEKDKLMIFTNTRRVWRRNTRGDYWVLDLNTMELKQLGKGLPESSLMFAKFSPDAQKAAYVSKHNLYVENLENNVITQLTFDGSKTIINGTFDWVYEEELSLRDGFRWSPDGTMLAFWQLDASGVGEFLLINNTDSIYSFTKPVQYPKVGTTNSACKVGVISVNGGDPMWMDVPGDPRNNYIARMEWAPDSKKIIIQHLNRMQNHLQLMYCSAVDGKVNTFYEETDEAWIDVTNDFRWFNDGSEFLWVSEKDGWRHVYLISADGKSETLLTKGDYDIDRITNVDAEDGRLYFIASPENATQRYLYRVTMDGRGTLERITPENQPGTHGYQISPGADFAIHSYSSFDTPGIRDIVSLPDHKVMRQIYDNAALKEKVDALDRLPTEFFQVDIGDGIVFDAWMIKPPTFNESKKYPVLFYVYGEPAGQTTRDAFSTFNYLWHLLIAQKGYIVISVDTRGTPCLRGRAWRKVIYKKIGYLNAKEQAAAAKKITEMFPFVDKSRLAIWGWSGGGSSTLNAMFQYPDVYNTGMAVAPVSNQLHYDTIYQERYMGLPADDPEPYKKGSPVTYAKNLKGNLLVMHGTGDDNVHYQGTETLINELIANNKIFSVMPFPNRTHGIFEGRNTIRYVREYLLWYLTTNMPAD